MVLYSHNPALHLTIYVQPPQCPHINEVNLETIAELRRQDWPLCTLTGFHHRGALVANIAKPDKQLAQLIHWTEERRTVRKSLVNLQMALPAVSLMNNIK